MKGNYKYQLNQEFDDLSVTESLPDGLIIENLREIMKLIASVPNFFALASLTT